MSLPTFKIEQFWEQYEFTAPYTLGSSDAESIAVKELLNMADSSTLELWDNLKLGYTETHGLPLLREEISQLYTHQKPDNIVVTAGAEEGIYLTMRVLIQPGDHVVVVTPCYQSLKSLPQAIGANVTEYRLEWHNHAWTFNLEKFRALVTPKTKMIVVNFPHNPTGFHPSQALFQDIVTIAKENQVYLLNDEVYRLSEYDSAHCLPNIVDCYEKGISLGVMSKAFGLPGLRIGWLATHDKALINRFVSYKHYTSICCSAPSEILSVMALRNKDKLLKRNITIAQRNLDRLDAFFNQYQTIYEWYRPCAGFISFPRLKSNVSTDKFVKDFIDKEGVILLPGTLFDDHNNHFRIGFGRLNLPEILERFERFTKQLIP